MKPLIRIVLLALCTVALGTSGCADSDSGGSGDPDAGTDQGGDANQDLPVTPVCGDGFLTSGEPCDGTAGPSGCTGGQLCNSACTACFDPPSVCGDGILSTGEDCDPAATPTGCTGADQICNANCNCAATGPVCGNGDLEGGEACDGSATITGCDTDQTCNVNCTLCVDDDVPACGDGTFVAGTEICDGSDTNDDGCDPGFDCANDCSQCVEASTPECGDGEVNGEETCDGSALEDDGCELPNVCNEDCSACDPPAEGCGDGALDDDETCDASSVLDTGCDPPETCNASCTDCEPPPPACGDGSINGVEDCDFSAEPEGCEDGEFCNEECSCDDIPVECGNSAIDTDETCDATAEPTGCDEGSACSDDCLTCVPIGCGDGTLDDAEVCDQSADDNGCAEFSVCSDDCTLCSPVCGDLVLDEGETCDFDGLFGEPGEVCDYEAEYCNSSCECEDLALEGAIDAAFLSPIPSADAFISEDIFSGVWSLDVDILDTDGLGTGGFSTFVLLFTDVDGNVLDFVQGGRDLIVRSEIIGEDVNAYSWRLQFHLLFGVPPTTEFVLLVLYTEDGRPSNLMSVADFEDLIGGDACDDGSLFTQCEFNFACLDPSDGAVCTDLGDVLFEQTALTATVDESADTLDFALEITDADDLADLVTYWLLGVVWDDDLDDDEGPFITATFAGFDEIVDNEDGTFSGSLLISEAADAFGIDLINIIEVGSLVFDTARWDGLVVDPTFVE